jgi:predicted RNA-binding protein with PIN domain
MPVIIDGHNLIGRMSGISLADPHDEEKLIRILAQDLHLGRQKATVVFDKAAAMDMGARYETERLRVIFAPPESSADAIIMDIIKNDPNPRGLTVVTSDNEIRRCARSRRARLISSEDFARRLESPALNRRVRRPVEHGEDFDVDDWLQYFKRRRK